MKLRLRPWLVLVFVGLVVPVFGLVLVFNYLTAERVAREAANSLVERALHEAGARTRELIEPMRSMVRAAAGLASAQPEFLRSAAGMRYLSEVLAHDDSVTGVFAGFADASFRGVFRVGPDTVFQGIKPPPQASQAQLWVDVLAGQATGQRLVFVDSKRRSLAEHVLAIEYDPRSRPWYRASLAAGDLNVSDPYVFAATGETGLSVAAPFGLAGTVMGVVGADITLAEISRHMADRRVSPGAETILVDDRGQVLAHADLSSVRVPGQSTSDETTSGQAVPAQTEQRLASLDQLGGELAASALLRGRRSPGQVFYLDEGLVGEPTAAIMLSLRESLGKPWELLALVPVSDFSGDLHDNNRRILMIGLAALLLQVAVIIMLARTMAEPLERLASRVDRIRSLRSDTSRAEQSKLQEIEALSQAVGTLQATVNSFAAYVPRGLVRQLVQTGQALKPGGESRYLTLMFTDIQDFSALSERLPSQVLLKQISAYLGLVTEVVETEQGTVDKFIGDGAMAFWGAPTPVADHAVRACVAALRIQRGLAALNEQWRIQGLEPLTVRIGLHCDSVLVGNIGSQERMSYTVLGDGVNVAAYMETANKTFGTSLCISQAVVREAGHCLCVRPLDQVSVKNRQSAILVYELLGVFEQTDASELAPSAAAIQLSQLTANAWRARQQEGLAEARARYGEVLRFKPDDRLASRMLQVLV